MNRLWWALSLVVAAVIVVATCWNVTELPQLEPDEYRYLSLLQDLEHDGAGLTDAFLVENRWDHIWFTATDSVVRFFRPTVVTSFWLDGLLWPGYDGLLYTNVLLHLGCSVLVVFILGRLLDSGPAVLLASALFAGFSCHAETIWYVSGRTDTLASLGFLGALALHVWSGRWPSMRWIALPVFAFALFSKELTAALPVILILYDRYVARRDETLLGTLRRDRWLWAGYLAVGAVFGVVRQIMLGGSGSDLGYPYFVSPTSGLFPMHLLAQLRSYAGNVLAGEITPPFGTPEQIFGEPYATALGWILTGIVPVACLWLLRRDPRLLLFAAIAVLTWLPTCFVYVSERYLYLPSLGFAGVAGLLIVTLRRQETARWVVLVLVAGWTVHQSVWLTYKNRSLSTNPREALALEKQLEVLARRGERMPKGAKILFVNFPGEILHSQFLEPQLRVYYGDPTLSARVVTLMHNERAQLPDAPEIIKSGKRELTIRGSGNLMAAQTFFDWVPFDTGTKVAKDPLGFRVEVLDGAGATCRSLRIVLDEPVESYVILRFERGDPAADEQPYGIPLLAGRIERIRP